MNAKKKVCIVGVGDWACSFAKLIGLNIKKYNYFDKEVKLCLLKNDLSSLHMCIVKNKSEECDKFLHCHKLPENVVLAPDIFTAKVADIIIFAFPYEFTSMICDALIGNVKESAIGISAIKGFKITENKNLQLISTYMHEMLSLPIYVIMGAYVPDDIISESYCECTLGCNDLEARNLIGQLLQSDYFKISVKSNVEIVELCGILKVIVAYASDVIDKLQYGDNSKVALIRLGFMEIIKFCEVFYGCSDQSIFFESCGIAELISACYGNQTNLIKDSMSDGEHLVSEIYQMIKSKDMEKRFPLFTAVCHLCNGKMLSEDLIDYIRIHPEHL